ncbi:Methylmalonyl-CoA epimerase [Litoreibacter arenae DSM 19593]|uniref:Methylmalonyl-CoA epimerase n=1 Tax=Litoreibacter arenae DSM 19593 TaxID=1123360 RepID=S9S0U0_9RHOB|nr:Methylmalonyl-CoA epimerase [Litoreibacter arenae DSM 19593]
MKHAIPFVLSAFFATQGTATSLPENVLLDPLAIGPYEAVDANLSDFLWLKRAVVVFADTPADPRFIRQIELLVERPAPLIDREVVILVDTDPKNPSDIRLKLRPRGFMMVLVGKDGEVELRKPSPWDVREITRAIDKMPLRRQELKDRRAAQDAELND